MIAKTYSDKEISLLIGRAIFFDANVLMYIFFDSARQTSHFNKSYTAIYSKLCRQKNDFKISFVVLSEIINSVLRTDFKEQNKLANFNTFKDYRKSEKGIESLRLIHEVLKNAIEKTKFNIIGENFSKENIYSFLEVNDLDFSDKAIYHICKKIILFCLHMIMTSKTRI